MIWLVAWFVRVNVFVPIKYKIYSCIFFVHTLSVKLQDDVWTKKKFSTFSYKLVQISPIMILVNSGAFLSISSWFCELTELIFVMIPYIYYNGYPPTMQKGLWVCASSELDNAI